MTSDPFKLVTDRRFHELREEAVGVRLARATQTEATPKRRDSLTKLAKVISFLTRTRRDRIPVYEDIHDRPAKVRRGA